MTSAPSVNGVAFNDGDVSISIGDIRTPAQPDLMNFDIIDNKTKIETTVFVHSPALRAADQGKMEIYLKKASTVSVMLFDGKKVDVRCVLN